MTRLTVLLIILIISFSIAGCFKKPIACIEVSNENPIKNIPVDINGFCSEDAKFYEYEIDGVKVWGDTESDIQYAFPTVGQHTIKLTIYTKFSGTYNSRTGCTGCTGAGKTNSTTKVITVTN